MESKVSIGSLAGALSIITGKSRKLCEDFLKEFFRLSAEVLSSGDSLRIKGFGAFKVIEVEGRTGVNVNTGQKQEIAPYKKVVFTPARELASSINAPFEDFESIEMEDEESEDLIFGYDKEREVDNEDLIEPPILEAGSDEEEEDDEITFEAYKAKPSSDEYIPVQWPISNYEPPVKSKFGLGFSIGALSALVICFAIFILGCFLNWWLVDCVKKNEAKAEDIPIVAAEPAAETDSIPMVIEEITPVYDTVSTTRYLTTIAREHYGNFNFWPYIYIENESILGHPDRITPGTKVVVPSLSRYGVDPESKEDEKKAKNLGLEIYSRFK